MRPSLLDFNSNSHRGVSRVVSFTPAAEDGSPRASTFWRNESSGSATQPVAHSGENSQGPTTASSSSLHWEPTLPAPLAPPFFQSTAEALELEAMQKRAEEAMASPRRDELMNSPRSPRRWTRVGGGYEIVSEPVEPPPHLGTVRSSNPSPCR